MKIVNSYQCALEVITLTSGVTKLTTALPAHSICITTNFTVGKACEAVQNVDTGIGRLSVCLRNHGSYDHQAQASDDKADRKIHLQYTEFKYISMVFEQFFFT